MCIRFGQTKIFGTRPECRAQSHTWRVLTYKICTKAQANGDGETPCQDAKKNLTSKRWVSDADCRVCARNDSAREEYQEVLRGAEAAFEHAVVGARKNSELDAKGAGLSYKFEVKDATTVRDRAIQSANEVYEAKVEEELIVEHLIYDSS